MMRTRQAVTYRAALGCILCTLASGVGCAVGGSDRASDAASGGSDAGSDAGSGGSDAGSDAAGGGGSDAASDAAVDDAGILAADAGPTTGAIVHVTQVAVPQPISGDAFTSEYAFSHPIAQTPHFVVTNEDPTTLRTSDWEYGFVVDGSPDGFNESGSGRTNLAPGGTSSWPIFNNALPAGTYNAIACAWHRSELPSDGSGGWLSHPYDPTHCGQQSFTVSP
jgi:hypothetical protein